jgi:predicted HNH restriction endonuclease
LKGVKFVAYSDPNDPRKKAGELRRNKEHYHRNREKRLAQMNARRIANTIKWHDYKLTLSCVQCGFSHPAVLDFHHVVYEDKQSVGELARKGRITAAIEESKKCIPLCANCHRILHYNEREGIHPENEGV